MNQILPLQPGAIPAHISQSNRLSLNANAHANLQASFAVLRIRGKEWSIRHRGEEYVQKASPGVGHDGRPLPEMKLEWLDVVVVGMAAAISKKFYLGGYVDGASQAPDCFSINGVTPDLASAHKQNPTCATCPQNIWGSTTTQQGRKAKACRDGRRISVVPAGDLPNEIYGGPMLLDIPPTSLSVLDSYVRSLERLGADISEVITRISFREGISHQELVFTTVGWVPTAEAIELIKELNQSDSVHRMLNDEVGEVTYDPTQPQAPVLPPRPAHLQAVPSQPATRPVVQGQTPAATPAAAPRATPFQQAATAPRPAQVAQVASVVQPAAVQAQPVAQPVVQPAAVQAPAQPAAVAEQPVTVVQGAPADMQAAINELLGG
jgi:hypothetical protein